MVVGLTRDLLAHLVCSGGYVMSKAYQSWDGALLNAYTENDRIPPEEEQLITSNLI